MTLQQLEQRLLNLQTVLERTEDKDMIRLINREIDAVIKQVLKKGGKDGLL